MSDQTNAGPRLGAATTADAYDPKTNPHPDAVVYLVQEPSVPKHSGKVMDISPLSWWGKVQVLLERSQAASFRPGPAYLQIGQRLKHFNPDKDYLTVAGGDVLGVILAGAVLAQMGHSHFYYLRFDRGRLPDGTRDPSRGAYIPLRVALTPEAAS